MLPAFAHARRNSRLTAVVSGDRTKRREIAKRYRLDRAFNYDEFDECLRSVDAVYIALPNSLHAEYTIRAARAGVHVLCEKPMAVTADECRQMTAACRRAGVKLMIAYRLHFETLNLAAIDLARSGRLGELECFNCSFSVTVRRGDIRTKHALRFGDERVATFLTSFNASDVASHRVVGTKGDLHADPAYEYAEGLEYTLTMDGKTSRKAFAQA